MEEKTTECAENHTKYRENAAVSLDEADDLPKVQLSHAISLSNVRSERGTVFEIADGEVDTSRASHDSEDSVYKFCDESLIKSLTLGAGGGMFDEDDSSSGDEADPFQKIARKMEDINGDDGVLKMEVSPGFGSDLPKGAFVTFHYSAFLEFSDEPFDSTHLRNKPERKLLDGPDILPGVNIALKSMRKGETSRFLIRPQYAFGKVGCPPRIPGDESILYEISVISAVDSYAADCYEEQDQQCATFMEKLEGARGYHRKGNDLYRDGDLLGAKKAYTRAVWILEDARLKDSKEEQLRGSVLVKLRSNLAQVFLDLQEPGKACTQCKFGLAVTGTFSDDIKSKLHYRFGKARTVLCDFDGALKELRRAQRLRPHNEDISNALESLLNKKEKSEAQERFLYRKMFQTEGKEMDEEQGLNSATKRLGIDKGQKDHNDNVVLNIRPEFQKIVETQILNFAENPNVKELPFPSNLSEAEIAHVAAAAKAANLLVTVKKRGIDTNVMIMKKL